MEVSGSGLSHFIFLDFASKTNSTEVKLNSEGQEFV
jgi:hypothetical protein